jgi:hypothetical protein
VHISEDEEAVPVSLCYGVQFTPEEVMKAERSTGIALLFL